LRAWLKHAFAVESADQLRPSDEEAALVDRLAQAVVRRGMATPAILALECSRNLNFIASQVLVFFAPVARLIFNRGEYTLFTGFLERRGSIEYLCDRIEELQVGRDQAAGDEVSSELSSAVSDRSECSAARKAGR
jgi:hypothetical protein